MLAMGSYPVGIIALSAFASKVQVGQNNTYIASQHGPGWVLRLLLQSVLVVVQFCKIVIHRS